MSRETSKEFKLRDQDDYYDLEGIENFNTQKTNDLFEELDSKMMSDTSTDNPLANKDFVNSSITHMAATPRGNWANWAAVPTDPNQYPADADGRKKPSNNDYMVVQDMTGYVNPDEPSRTYEGTWRFTYIGEWDDVVSGSTRGKNGWKPIYQVNEKPLTQEQVNALNSGITAAKRTNYDSHLTNYNNPHQVTKDHVGLGNVNNTSDMNKPVSTAQQTELDKKVNIKQGSQNEGKILGINDEGNVIPIDPPQSGATPEQLATKLDKTIEVKKIAVVSELPKAIDLYTLYFVVEEEGEWPGLKFTSQQDGSTVGYQISKYDHTGTIDKDIYTSTDGKNWTSWDGSDIALNKDQKIYVWNKTNTLSLINDDETDFGHGGFLHSTSPKNYLYFKMTGTISASGNIMSMINFSELTPYCFAYLFSGGGSSLISAPYLPATNLAEHCYSGMFLDCTNLITAPDLPATTLKDYCYAGMFYNCSSLTTAPELPSTNLAYSCYASMFFGCSSITTAPDLPATNLVDDCYTKIFLGCTSLNSIKLYYTGNFDSENIGPFYNWVYNVSSTGILYYNGSDTTRGVSAIPQNWAVQAF